MTIKDNFYFSPFMSERLKKKYMKKLHNKKKISKCFLLISRCESPNLLEIVSSNELYRLDLLEADISVFGMTQNKEESIDWIVQKVQATVTKHHTVNKKTLLMELEL